MFGWFKRKEDVPEKEAPSRPVFVATFDKVMLITKEAFDGKKSKHTVNGPGIVREFAHSSYICVTFTKTGSVSLLDKSLYSDIYLDPPEYIRDKVKSDSEKMEE